MFAGSQSGSISLSVWYQTIESFPASPATAHGHSTRAFGGLAMSTGADQVFPKSVEYAILTWLGSGRGAFGPGDWYWHGPVVPARRSSVSQIRYRLSELSKMRMGKCENSVVGAAFTGVIFVSPDFQTLAPMPVTVPLASLNSTGSTSLPLWWS